MANVADLLKRNKDKIKKIKSQDKSRKKIKRSATRPWHDLGKEEESSKSIDEEKIIAEEMELKRQKDIQAKRLEELRKRELEEIVKKEAELKRREEERKAELILKVKEKITECKNIKTIQDQILEDRRDQILREKEERKVSAARAQVVMEADGAILPDELPKEKIEKPKKAPVNLPKKIDITEFVPKEIKADPSEKKRELLKDYVPIEKNFMKLPNNLLGAALFEYNLSAVEFKLFLVILRLSLGFKKNHVKITQKEISFVTGIHHVNVNKSLKGLLAKGIVRATKISRNENIYVLSDDLLNGDSHDFILKKMQEYKAIHQEEMKSEASKNLKKEKKKNEFMFSAIIDRTLAKFSGTHKFKEMNYLNHLLIQLNIPIEIIEEVLMDLEINGDLKGKKVDRPFSYLASGVFEKIKERLNRVGGINSKIDGKKIKDIISNYNTRQALPKDVDESLTEDEWDFIRENGGREALSFMSAGELSGFLGGVNFFSFCVFLLVFLHQFFTNSK